MVHIVAASTDAHFAATRRLFGAYRRAVEGLALAADVCT